MTPQFSVYLDLLRSIAAIVVLLSHCLPPMFHLSGMPGHDAVIVFFVLSGYVIAFVAEKRERTPRHFVLARLARLWSVAVPAAVLAGIAGAVIASGGLRAIGSAAPPVAGVFAFIQRAGANLFFMGEWWSKEIEAPYNAPMWSLNYEAWYYAIFAGWLFLPRRRRVVGTAVLALLAGPKVLTLMPCWLLGVGLFRYRDRLVIPSTWALGLLFLSLALYAVVYLLDPAQMSRDWLRWLTAGESYHLGPSQSVVGDLILALVVGLNFIAMANMPAALGNFLLRLKRPIVSTASYTLSVYLYHVPLFVIFYGWLGLGRQGGFGAIAALMAIGLSIVLLGRLTEHQRAAWRSALAYVSSSRVKGLVHWGF